MRQYKSRGKRSRVELSGEFVIISPLKIINKKYTQKIQPWFHVGFVTELMRGQTKKMKDMTWLNPESSNNSRLKTPDFHFENLQPVLHFIQSPTDWFD